MVRVAVAQFKASTEKNENLKKITRYICRASARGASLIAFPEFMMFYTPSSQTPAELAALAEPMTGEFVGSVADCARANSIEVVGTFYEKSPKRNRVYDTSFLADASGKISSYYRKIHLYDALGFRESDKMVPGTAIPEPAGSRMGRMGMLICYDLRFPEISRILASSGSEVLAAPSAWVKGELKEEHWIALNRTRAVENGCYMISPDQVGNIYCGRSLVVDPYGRIILDMKKREGVGYAEIVPELVRETRKLLPLLKNRRTDLYRPL